MKSSANWGAISVFRPGEVSAEAYYFPTEGQGSGDYSIVRSSDSSRHWVEIARSRMHATEPSVSLVDAKLGWMSGMSVDASTCVLRTEDAGARWRTLPDHFVQNMQFINSRICVGSEFDGSYSRFARTSDGGRTWSRDAVPELKFIDKVFFLTPEIGWIAGTNEASGQPSGSAGFVWRTTDGGRPQHGPHDLGNTPKSKSPGRKNSRD